jgi:hypothetical protein
MVKFFEQEYASIGYDEIVRAMFRLHAGGKGNGLSHERA